MTTSTTTKTTTHDHDLSLSLSLSSAAAAAAASAERPEDYKSMKRWSPNADVEDIYRKWDHLVDDKTRAHIELLVRRLAAAPPEDERAFERELWNHRREHGAACADGFRKAQIMHVYNLLVHSGEIAACPPLRRLLVKKSTKSQSGVLVITVLTSPYPSVGGATQRFSCAWNCYYCPSEPDQPKSYLHDEPAVKRANENHFDAVLQLTDRAATLAMNGHPVDKIELLVLGGTQIWGLWVGLQGR
jgi:hypothetical protein